jgi:cell division protein ZapA (FtsZ GTPase activity inhibitor)
MNEVAVKSGSSDVAKIAVLAALNIVDELFLSHRKRINSAKPLAVWRRNSRV